MTLFHFFLYLAVLPSIFPSKINVENFPLLPQRICSANVIFCGIKFVISIMLCSTSNWWSFHPTDLYQSFNTPQLKRLQQWCSQQESRRAASPTEDTFFKIGAFSIVHTSNTHAKLFLKVQNVFIPFILVPYLEYPY